MSQEIITLRKEAKAIIQKGTNIIVKDETTFNLASEVLSQANIKLKDYKAERKELTDPFEQKIKEIEIQYTPSEKALDSLVKQIRNQLGEYKMEQNRIQAEAEAKIAARTGKGKGKLSVETASQRMDEIDKAPVVANTGSGTVRFRADKKLKIVDAAKIPRAYLIPNEDLILEDLKAGKKVAGCEIKIIQTPINNTR